jgi:hypothetical protein
MTTSRSSADAPGRVRAVHVQLLATLPAIAWLLLGPPAQGMMMLVPLNAHAAQALPGLVVHGETRLVAAGPLPGSLIVYGRRADLAWPLLARGVLTFVSLRQGCSKAAS